MRLAHSTLLEDFGTRSLAIHGIMVIAFVNAVLAGLVIGGELGAVAFVALLGFAAGLWVSHSVHSLGNALGDDEYVGVLNELVRAAERSNRGLTVGRFGRLLSLVAVVTAISLLTAGQVLAGAVLSVVVVAVGVAVAVGVHPLVIVLAIDVAIAVVTVTATLLAHGDQASSSNRLRRSSSASMIASAAASGSSSWMT